MADRTHCAGARANPFRPLIRSGDGRLCSSQTLLGRSSQRRKWLANPTVSSRQCLPKCSNWCLRYLQLAAVPVHDCLHERSESSNRSSWLCHISTKRSWWMDSRASHAACSKGPRDWCQWVYGFCDPKCLRQGHELDAATGAPESCGIELHVSAEWSGLLGHCQCMRQVQQVESCFTGNVWDGLCTDRPW